jgi:hypothetical protein
LLAAIRAGCGPDRPPWCLRAPSYWQHDPYWRARYLLDVCRRLEWLFDLEARDRAADHAEKTRQRAMEAAARERFRVGGFGAFDRHARSLEDVRRERDRRAHSMAAYVSPL